MTIKNTQKNISDEEGLVLTDVVQNELSMNNSTKNYSNLYELTFSFKDWENEDEWENRQDGSLYNENPDYEWDSTDNSYKKTISFPANDIAKLTHLNEFYYDKNYIEQNYFTKDEVNNKIKIHFYVWETTTPPTLAQVKNMENYENYIFLVPYNPDYNNDNNDDTIQDGGYREYAYIKRGNTESIEMIGSTQINLAPYLKIEDFDTVLEDVFQDPNSSLHTLANQVDVNTNNIRDKLDKTQTTANAFLLTDANKSVINQTKIGNIDINGNLYTSNSNTKQTNKILTTDSNGLIIGSDAFTTEQIKSASNISGQISATQNTTSQDTINLAINNKLGDIDSQFNNYLLTNDIKTEIWGNTNGSFASMQSNESNNTYKNYKLGDYIHYRIYESGDFYTAQEIDTLIQSVIDLQTQTLSLL